MPSNKMAEKTFEHIENEEAKALFLMYRDLNVFADKQDYDVARDLNDRLRKDTIRNAAAILHDAAMKLEFNTLLDNAG